jgi:hypothetical protein
MRYTNKTQGVVTLFVNSLPVAKKRFRTTSERKSIMNGWGRAFEFIAGLSTVYMELYHYEVERDPEIKDATKMTDESVSVKKKVYEKSKHMLDEPEKPKMVRAKSEYSNNRGYDY